MTTPIDRRAFAAILATPLLSGAAPARRAARRAAPSIGVPDDALLRDLPRRMEVAGVPGVAIGVVRDGRAGWQRVLGTADTGTGRPATAESLWPAASLSKPVCALAALRLVDEGLLDLDRPLRAYVPGHAPDDPRGDRITARHVLSHTSGLRNWRNRADDRLVPDFDPGARFQYSGEGFYWLQRAMENVAGVAFARLMEQRVFEPLGMASSSYTWRADTDARLVAGHENGQSRPSFSRDRGLKLLAHAEARGTPLAAMTHEAVVAALEGMTPRPVPAILPNYLTPNAASTLVTTPADYAAFLVATVTNAPAAVALRAATHATMTSPQVKLNGSLSWGLGWGLERQRGDASRQYLWHWGDNGLWKNFVLVHPASRSAVVVFTNGARGMNVARDIVGAATGEAHDAFLWL